jgi:hypothetical protein
MYSGLPMDTLPFLVGFFFFFEGGGGEVRSGEKGMALTT